MTAAAPPLLRTVAFGDVEAGVWGAAWEPADELIAFAGGDGAEAMSEAHLEGSSMEVEWRLSGAGTELVLAPVGEPVNLPASEGIEVIEQLCRASGRLQVGGASLELSCLGRRSTRAGDGSPELDSIRDVSAWFEDDQGLAVTALRPRRARGHDRDAIIAALLGEPEPVSVFDPRLSTTYDAAGEPLRAGVELWLGDEESEEQTQYPRRAAGEAVGSRAAGHAGDYAVQAALFRWHSRGRDGSGVYLLARSAAG